MNFFHRRTNRGLVGLLQPSPLSRMKHFWAIAEFFWQQPAAKMKKHIFVFIKHEKIHFVIIGWDESVNAILNETLLCKLFQFIDSMLFGHVR